MSLQTRVTQALGIEHPVLLAPMDLVATGKLASAVSQAGGLGLIGGGYGDADWVEQEFRSRREREGRMRLHHMESREEAGTPRHLIGSQPLCCHAVLR